MSLMPDTAFEWRTPGLVDSGPPVDPEPVADPTILVPEPTEAIANPLAAHWTRRNIVSGDEDWAGTLGSASRVEAVNTNNGDATITAAAGTFEDWDVGAAISGAGIPVGTTILTVTDSGSAEMSANATASAGAVAATIRLHGVQVVLSPGEAYLTPCPAGDFEVIALASFGGQDNRMAGPMIVDAAGNGILSCWFNPPQSYLTCKAVAWAYSGAFTQGPATAMPAATTALKLRKSGTNYYTSYSTDYGATWSAETPALANATFVPTQMGFGSILGNVTAKLHEFYPGPEEADPDPEPDPEPTGEWVVNPDRSHGLESLSLTYGRPDAASGCRPLATTVVLAQQVAGTCPPTGERFRLALSDAAAAALGLAVGDAAALFTGEVTDPTIDPVRRTYEVTGTGRLGRNNRRPLDAEDWPSELDGARVARIARFAGVQSGTIDPGTAQLLPPDGTATAGSLLETATDSTGGALVEQPDGNVDYHDVNHRRGVPVTVTLAAGQIDNRITWEQHVDDLLNEMEVSWADGLVTARDPSSIALRDVFPGRLTTALTTASDAHSLGQLMVSRRAEPVWQLPNLEVDLMRMVDDELRGQLLGLRQGDRLLITGLPGTGPYLGDVEFFVEGWKMRLDRPHPDLSWRWKFTLSVSDPALSGVSLRWIDLPVGLAWNELDVGLSWYDLGRIEDPADL